MSPLELVEACYQAFVLKDLVSLAAVCDALEEADQATRAVALRAEAAVIPDLVTYEVCEMPMPGEEVFTRYPFKVEVPYVVSINLRRLVTVAVSRAHYSDKGRANLVFKAVTVRKKRKKSKRSRKKPEKTT